MNLPDEIWEKILADPKLPMSDVFNFCQTCSRFHENLRSNYLWRRKFLQRWPKTKIPNQIENWYEEVRYRLQLHVNVRSILATMPAKYCCYVDISDSEFVEWIHLSTQHPRAYEYIIDYLREIAHSNVQIHSVNIVPTLMPGNYTLRYYTLKVLRFLRKWKLRTEWEFYTQLPAKNRLMEKGAVIINQWCQPEKYIEYEDVARELDAIADAIKAHLKSIHPKHSIFKKSEEELNRWKIAILDDNQYEIDECRKVMDAIKHVMVKDMRFNGASQEMYYDPRSSFISEVLSTKEGLPILLSIIYESIGRRLGVLFEPINFPTHFMLKYREGRGSHKKRPTFIDGFNRGIEFEASNCDFLQNLKPDYPVASTLAIMTRMCANLENSLSRSSRTIAGVNPINVLELSNTVDPCDMNTVVQLARQYMLYNMDTGPLEERLKIYNPPSHPNAPQVQHIIKMLHDYEKTVKVTGKGDSTFFGQIHTCTTPRNPNVKFAVGMVMRHLKQNYICVICDWHPTCMASADWQKRMEVHTLKFKDKQPFYSVIADDGSHRYVAQENMEISTANEQLLAIEDIGRQFSHYFRTHFVPNEQKEKNYPDDAQVRHHYYQLSLWGNKDYCSPEDNTQMP